MAVEKAKTGNPGKQSILHDGYTVLVDVERESARRRILRYIKGQRKALISQLGASHEKELAGSQRLLLDRLCQNLALVRSMEEKAREDGLKLPQNHLSYCSQISRDLKALGLDGKRKRRPPTREELEAL